MLESLTINAVTAIVFSKWFLTALGWFLASTLVFWLLWVNLNVLHNRMQKRTGWRKVLVGLFFWPLLPVGALVDVVYNKTLARLLFLEWGCETTLSMRMHRYIAQRTCDKMGHADYGYRVPVAVWISAHLVEPWQPGHIGIEKYGYPAAQDAMTVFLKRFKRLLP